MGGFITRAYSFEDGAFGDRRVVSEKDGGPECRAKRNCVHRQRIFFRPLPDMKLRHQVTRLVASSLFFLRSSSVQPISDRESSAKPRRGSRGDGLGMMCPGVGTNRSLA
jgi:hypothetical protein